MNLLEKLLNKIRHNHLKLKIQFETSDYDSPLIIEISKNGMYFDEIEINPKWRIDSFEKLEKLIDDFIESRC